jgi:hypothetical protein
MHNHQSASFLTLTYDSDHLPWDGSLNKQHLTKFFKDLRIRHPDKKLRYYACGEYGEKLSRPHYHICLYGYDFPDRDLFKSHRGNNTYTSKELSKIWKRGFHTIGQLNWNTAAYTARYVMKKINGTQSADAYLRPHHLITDLEIQVEPEFTTMSLKPGIGADWFLEFETDVFPSDEIILKGKRFAVPSYYTKIKARTDPEYIENLKITRRLNAVKHEKNNTPERLKAREKYQTLQTTMLKRSYEDD